MQGYQSCFKSGADRIMRILLLFVTIGFAHGCFKKATSQSTDSQMIQRDTDILNEEDLEDLPEN